MAADLSRVHSALISSGYQLVQSDPILLYEGELIVLGESIKVRLYLFDLNFVELPLIQLLSKPSKIPLNSAHLSPSGFVCYFLADQAHLPRENIAGGILGCLIAAQTLLERLSCGEALTDTRDEFLVHWKGGSLLLDIPKEIAPCLIKNASIVDFKTPELGPLNTWLLGENEQILLDRYSSWGAQPQLSSVAVRVADIDNPVGASSENWPPENLGDLRKWLLQCDPKGNAALLESLKDAFSLKTSSIVLLIRAPNANCAAFIDLGVATKLIKTKSAASFMRAAIKAHSKSVKIIRLNPISIDPKSWIDRNLPPDKISLSGKNIFLVGCGAIGGYLADLLAKEGAGFLGGKLTLIDADDLSVGNLGRNFLGFSYLGHKKSKSLCIELESRYPGINIEEISSRLEYDHVKSADLLVDATANEGLSNFLCELRMQGNCPPIIFAWVSGMGCGAQSYILVEKEQACLRCLEYSRPGGQFSVMAKGYELNIKRSGACSDWSVPFSASAAIHAAALAASTALDWANGNAKPFLRSITLDQKLGKLVKAASPKFRKACQVCGTYHL